MGHKVYFFGDVHFSAMHPWLIETGNKFIDWFMNSFKENHKEDYIIFLGDVTDKHINPGGVIKQAFRLFEFCNNNFKKTYVLTGNHDKKLYRDVIQSSLQFLECFDNIHVIENIETIKIEDKTILALPHIRTNNLLSDYYTDYDWKSYVKEHNIADVGIGHWTVQSPEYQFSRSGVDITNIPARKWVVGHIHNRPEEYYTGSIWPCNYSEQDCKYPRCYKEWNLKTNEWTEHTLPQFLIYKEINYPNKIDIDKNGPIVVFTVNGIKNKSEAEAFYKDAYIRDVNRNITKQELNAASSDEIFLYKTNREAFEAMLEETGMEVSVNTKKIIEEIL